VSSRRKALDDSTPTSLTPPQQPPVLPVAGEARGANTPRVGVHTMTVKDPTNRFETHGNNSCGPLRTARCPREFLENELPSHPNGQPQENGGEQA